MNSLTVPVVFVTCLKADKPLASFMGSSLGPIFSEMAYLFQTQWAICPRGFDFWAEPCLTT